MNSCTPVGAATWTHLSGYARLGELFLTERLDDPDERAALAAEYAHLSRRVPDLGPIRATDEFWRYSTSEQSWKNHAGRAGSCIVRDGVIICTGGLRIMS